MLIVIFGAGASYDSLHSAVVPAGVDAHLRPPLANELFANRPPFQEIAAKYSPYLTPILNELRYELLPDGVSLERTIARLERRATEKGDEARQRQIIALRCYLRDVTYECGEEWHSKAGGGSTNYSTLFERLREFRLDHDLASAVITFNYDTMAERAAEQVFGFDGLKSIEWYLTGPLPIYKPHGSSNWVRGFRSNLASFHDNPDGFDLIANHRHLEFIDRYGLMHTCKAGHRFPAVAAPIEQKDEYDFPANHRDAMCGALERATRVLIIGWRGTEALFLSDFAQRVSESAVVSIVADNEVNALETAVNLSNHGIRNPLRALSHEGFTRFVMDYDAVEAAVVKPEQTHDRFSPADLRDQIEAAGNRTMHMKKAATLISALRRSATAPLPT